MKSVPFLFCMKEVLGIGVIDIEETELKETIERKQEIAWWDKYTLSVQEAAEYFGISEKKIRIIINEHKHEKFILWNGSRPRIKRKLFEKYIDEKLMVI